MGDFAFIEEKLNVYFSDGLHRIVVIPKTKSGDNIVIQGKEYPSETTEQALHNRVM